PPIVTPVVEEENGSREMLVVKVVLVEAPVGQTCSPACATGKQTGLLQQLFITQIVFDCEHVLLLLQFVRLVQRTEPSPQIPAPFAIIKQTHCEFEDEH
ncbi:unnamed protein product, partial [Didymodactylos carnosus]